MLLRSLCFLICFISMAQAKPPAPPADFATPQSPTRPAPFDVKYKDQGEYDPRLKGLLAPEGFKLEIIADAPTVINPVGITFGPDASLYVLEWAVDPITKGAWFEFKETFHYRDGSTKAVATMKKFVMDPIKVMKLNPKTMQYDKAETIIADELPSSLLYHDGWLYTASRGTVRRYKQSRPNGPWDLRETIAQGFCGFHHHQVSGISIGLDGLLYITSGDDDNFAEGSDGTRATALRTGAIFRCRPDGSNLELYSLGYRNPYRDIAHDDNYNWFHADNDNEDGSRFTGCRLMHIGEGVDYGWRLKVGARCCQPDHLRGAVAGELPGKVPPMLKTGRGSPAGLLLYHETQIPEAYRGLHYYPDVFRRSVRAYTVVPQGASFAITHEFEFLKSDDPLFRPCQMVTGPDGAIYICDWRTDSGGAGRLSGDGVHGRIYRMTWVGDGKTPAIPLRNPNSWLVLKQQEPTTVALALSDPNLTIRVEARKELVRRGEAGREAALVALKDAKDKHTKLAAIGVLDSLSAVSDLAVFASLMTDESEDVRRVVIDALGRHSKPKDPATFEVLLKKLNDPSPVVRRAVALAMGRVGANGTADVLLNGLKADEASGDVFLLDAYIRGLEMLGKPGMDALLSVANSGNEADLNRAVKVTVALRTRPGIDLALAMLDNPHVTDAQQVALVESLASYQFDPPVPMDKLAEKLATRTKLTPAMAQAALDTLAATDGLNKATGAGLVSKWLVAPEIETRAAALNAIETGRLKGAASAVLTMALDSQRITPERSAALKAYRACGSSEGASALLPLLEEKVPTFLRAEALRTLAALNTKAAFDAAAPLLASGDITLVTEAINVLGTTREGARMVGERYKATKLPKETLPRVSQALRNFPNDNVLTALHAEVMKGGLLIGQNPEDLERIRKLVASKGDAKKGKALYLDAKVLACASCHKMEGTGGAVGPDLTRIWDTMTVEKLVETVLDPSKEIKEGYQSFRAVSKAGSVTVGLKVTDTATEVVIREATGKDIRIAKVDLEELTAVKQSLMPENVVSQLSYDQFIDLLAFLKSQREQEGLRK